MEHDTLMDLSDLVRENKKHEQAQLDLFKEELKKCHALIRRKNKDGFRFTTYDVPTMIWGKPNFDVATMRNYILVHLHENGFYVELRPNGRSLYICWHESVLDLDKFYRHKTQVEREYRQNNYGLPHTVNRNTMEFRQEKQRELQEQRNQRFNLQKQRFAHLPTQRY